MDTSKAVEWHVHKTPQYELRSNEFRRAIDGLIEKAREKNLDGVSLSYVEMTLSCVKCHKYVRNLGMGWLGDPTKSNDEKRDAGLSSTSGLERTKWHSPP